MCIWYCYQRLSMKKFITYVSFIVFAICVPCLLFASCQKTPPAVKDTFYTISVTASQGGTVTPNGTTNIKKGNSVTVSIQADEGYFIDSVVCNQQVKPDVVGKTSYAFTLSNVQENQSIQVQFYKQYQVSVQSDFQNEDESVSAAQNIDKYHPTVVLNNREFYQMASVSLQNYLPSTLQITFTQDGDGSLANNVWKLSTNTGKYIQKEIGLTVEVAKENISITFHNVSKDVRLYAQYQAQQVEFSVRGMYQVWMGQGEEVWIEGELKFLFSNYPFTYHFTFEKHTDELAELLRVIQICEPNKTVTGLQVLRNSEYVFYSIQDIQEGKLQLTNENQFEVVYETNT